MTQPRKKPPSRSFQAPFAASGLSGGPKTAKPLLSEKKFREAVRGLKVGQKTIDIAYGVLVQGKSQTEFVRRTGMTKGAVSQAVGRVRKAFENRVPEGFQKITLLLPREKVCLVKKWAKTLTKDHESSPQRPPCA